MSGEAPIEPEDDPPKVATVSASILSAFFDELAQNEGFADTASALRQIILKDAVFAEPPIRAALFPSTPFPAPI